MAAVWLQQCHRGNIATHRAACITNARAARGRAPCSRRAPSGCATGCKTTLQPIQTRMHAGMHACTQATTRVRTHASTLANARAHHHGAALACLVDPARLLCQHCLAARACVCVRACIRACVCTCVRASAHASYLLNRRESCGVTGPRGHGATGLQGHRAAGPQRHRPKARRVCSNTAIEPYETTGATEPLEPLSA